MAARAPFRVTTPAPADVYRRPDGKFTRGAPAAPPQVVRRSSDQGTPVERVIAENRTPEHPRPSGSPPGSAEIPFGEAGPTYNDARRPAFRVTG